MAIDSLKNFQHLMRAPNVTSAILKCNALLVFKASNQVTIY